MYTPEQLKTFSCKKLQEELDMIGDLKGQTPEIDRDLKHYEIDLRYQINAIWKQTEQRRTDVNKLIEPLREWAIESDSNFERLKEILLKLNFL